MSWWHGLGAHVSLLRGRAAESRMQQEIRFHIDMETARLMREEKLDRAEARRRALVSFGAMESHKETLRDGRGLAWLGGFALDLKLGFRMLRKYPGLTLIGGVAIAFAIWVGGATFELVSQVMRPTLPLPDGDRIVALDLWNAQTSRRDPRLLHDLTVWREDAHTLQDLGAYRGMQRNVIIGRDGLGAPVRLAEISAAAFPLAGVSPVKGRALVESDEAPSAPNVIVIGDRLWQTRFEGDPNVVGRSVHIGLDEYTVVGVMPPAFGFPVSHQAWTPLRLNALDYPLGAGPALSGVFGKLAAGVSRAQAQAELTAIGARRSAAFPATYEYLRPRVGPFAEPLLLGVSAPLAWSVNLLLVLLLLLVCSNVALLMFARAATREAEIAVRTALGASRSRIVMQFFAEALVLGSLGALVGLSMLDKGLRWVLSGPVFGGDDTPFWIRDTVSPLTVLYIVGLTVLGAVVAGIVPGLKLTRGLSDRLRSMGAGGGGLRFGGVWTAIIVVQIALTVGLPALTYFVYRDTAQIRRTDIGVDTREYLTAQLQMDRMSATTPAAVAARFDTATRDLMRRLRADGAVRSATLAQRLPLQYHPASIVELDEGPAAPRRPEWPTGYRVSDAAVDLGFFGAFEAPALDGRLFRSSDVVSGDYRPVIVNQAFVQLVMGGRTPVGRRVRVVSSENDQSATREPGPWFEIVGVVKNMGNAVGASVTGVEGGHDPKMAAIYHPLVPGTYMVASVAIRLVPGTSASGYAQQLRAHADASDASLQLQDVLALDQITASELAFYRFWITLLFLVCGIALLLSLAGIYAVMSFAVARRTREIGIRVALGASASRVVTAVLRQPIIQVSIGIGTGVVLVAALSGGITGHLRWQLAGAIAAYALFMTFVCLLACLVPVRRALGVQPTDALRADL